TARTGGGRGMKVVVSPTKLELGRSAASAGAQRIREALEAKGEAAIILATGASQFEMLAELVNAPGVAWEKVAAFTWTDTLPPRHRTRHLSGATSPSALWTGCPRRCALSTPSMGKGIARRSVAVSRR